MSKRVLSLLGAFIALAPTAHALELDWSGQFRSEFNFIQGWTVGS